MCLNLLLKRICSLFYLTQQRAKLFGRRNSSLLVVW
jgi:hypothetical protein